MSRLELENIFTTSASIPTHIPIPIPRLRPRPLCIFETLPIDVNELENGKNQTNTIKYLASVVLLVNQPYSRVYEKF